MKIGFIGAGSMATNVALYAIKAGHSVTLLARNAERLAAVVKDLGASAATGTPTDLANSDILVLAVPWQNIKDALAGFPSLNGKILIDATNPFVMDGPDHIKIADLGGQTASEAVAGYAPGAIIVKAFNTIRAEHLLDGPKRGDARRVLFISGDDATAKAKVRALIVSFGFKVIDLGGLVPGGVLQQGGGALASGEDFLVAGESL